MNPTPPPVAEPGYTTTEFWVTLITMIIGLAVLIGPAFGLHLTINSADPATVQAIQYAGGILALVVPAIVYAISRAIRKIGTTSTPVTVTTTTSTAPAPGAVPVPSTTSTTTAAPSSATGTSP
jgi:hypothetical protein